MRMATAIARVRRSDLGAAWPTMMAVAAHHGLAGDVVRTLEPHTEADPHALLIQLLAVFGSVAGRGPHFTVEADRHGTNLFAVLVGETSKGRKGTSWGLVHRLFQSIDTDWATHRVKSGLSSGEGLIWAVRDAITRPEPARKRASAPSVPDQVLDPGITDKRLMVLESEFAAPLSIMRREGNTLSELLRQAWETGALQSLTKNSQAVATGAHVSVIGHVTRPELCRHLGETEAANGFANRILWACVRRAQILPEGGSLEAVDLAPLIRRLGSAVRFAHSAGELKRDSEARELWRQVYPALSEGQPGLYGAITSRAEAQTMRLALVYALLDESSCIRREHLQAGLAVWDYCAASCRYIFGDSLGDRVADALLVALRARPAGMTRNEIRDHFSGHAMSRDIERALDVLLRNGHAASQLEETGGRPAERWFARHGGQSAR
jgi:hypothetical protein